MLQTADASNITKQSTEKYDPGLKRELLMPDDIRDILQLFLFSVTCQLIDVFGAVTNVINIICFVKQGFKDPVNVSLLVFALLPVQHTMMSIQKLRHHTLALMLSALTLVSGLAISDLGSLTTLIWTNICLTPAFNKADLPFDSVEFQYLTSAWPHATFSRITSWITALITLERCLCITLPLKVKNFVTPKRVFIIIVFVYIIIISAITPVYSVYRLDMKYFPDRNKTLIGLASTQNRQSVETVSFAINIVILPACSFMLIIICTIILVISLRKSSKWRHKSASQTQDSAVNRNQKVSKMVVMISILFISCFVPFSIIFIGTLLEPGLSIDGKYRNMMLILIGVGIILESINSSVNIFIYYHMSSRFRAVFNQLFSKNTIMVDKYL